MKKNNKNGITLIALVITIVVILIIVGISIAFLSGDNGILNKAKLAKENSDSSQETENKTLGSYDNRIDEIVNGTSRGQGDLGITSDDQNVKMWLSKLGQTSLTLDDIVNGKSILDLLMNSKEAVDYMISNETIMNAVTNSQYAMQKLGNYNYAAYSAISNTNWLQKITSSSYVSTFDNTSTNAQNNSSIGVPFQKSSYSGNSTLAFNKVVSTSEVFTANQGESYGWYFGYNFNNPNLLYKAQLRLYEDLQPGQTYKMKLQGSNDGTNYTDISSEKSLTINSLNYAYTIDFDVNPTLKSEYKYYRIFVTSTVSIHRGGVSSVRWMELYLYGRTNS